METPHGADRPPAAAGEAPASDRAATAAASARPRTWSDRAALALGTGLGSGLSPLAPGTAGSIFPGLLLAWLLGRVSPWAGAAAAAPLFLAGWWAASRCIALLGRDDPPQVTI